MREVLPQSKRTVPVRSRTIPKVEPLGASGNPPAKSNFTLALVWAPRTSGPKASMPICDWRREPPKTLFESKPLKGVAISG